MEQENQRLSTLNDQYLDELKNLRQHALNLELSRQQVDQKIMKQQRTFDSKAKTLQNHMFVLEATKEQQLLQKEYLQDELEKIQSKINNCNNELRQMEIELNATKILIQQEQFTDAQCQQQIFQLQCSIEKENDQTRINNDILKRSTSADTSIHRNQTIRFIKFLVLIGTIMILQELL